MVGLEGDVGGLLEVPLLGFKLRSEMDGEDVDREVEVIGWTLLRVGFEVIGRPAGLELMLANWEIPATIPLVTTPEPPRGRGATLEVVGCAGVVKDRTKLVTDCLAVVFMGVEEV